MRKIRSAVPLQKVLKTEDPTDTWYPVDYLHGAARRTSFRMGDGLDNDHDGIVDNEADEPLKPYARALTSSVAENSDRYVLNVEDAASKINVNACDNLAVVLDNLCRLIGPPLVPADEDLLQPRCWYVLSGNKLTAYACNDQDTESNRDLYYALDARGRPVQRNAAPYKGILDGLSKKTDGTAAFGDGYAIAGYRGRHGPFRSLDQLKEALTFVDRNGNGVCDDPLERLEVEVKFAALRPYVTLDSWVDPTTVSVGKFEWVKDGVTVPAVRSIVTGTLEQNIECQILMDRDKSWVADDPVADPRNTRGSLRGSYLAIVNGHGAGQLRRIATNGTDWVAIRAYNSDERLTVPPGPISSYMIVAREDALLEEVKPLNGNPFHVPRTHPDGTLIQDPAVDYLAHPLCIFRAPVNINTASDKVLAALCMGINVQHGHPLAVGTDADYAATAAAWFRSDPHNLFDRLLTPQGLKRTPVSSGKPVFDRPLPALATSPDFDYLNNYGRLDPGGTANINEALELAFRIILARQRTKPAGTPDPDPLTADAASGFAGYERGPFRSWDDLYFRLIKPWDDQRFKDGQSGGQYHKSHVAALLMAHFNPNTDILKFNPNIEWIDRWSRNFTSLEPVMVFTDTPEPNYDAQPTNNLSDSSVPVFTGNSDPYLKEFGPDKPTGAYIVRSFRYKSSEMIDKTDLNRSTTEFSFDSGGIYEIQSCGQVLCRGQLLAERSVEALVKVYDVWRETTQRQFVNGTISEARNQNRAAGSVRGLERFACSGKVVRDAVNGTRGTRRLALDTAPEPLVPLKYTLGPVSRNLEVVDTATGLRRGMKRNITGDAVDLAVPDVVANRILPAGYDGQILLATNTGPYDPDTPDIRDTFLASFDGDLDTVTCEGNGHEQAKNPSDARVRVVDTCSLLGCLNDTRVDQDDDLMDLQTHKRRRVYKFSHVDPALRGLNPAYYWNNVTVRQGDLRPEGVYLSGPGVSGNEATLKYLMDKNLNPSSREGVNVSLWFKPQWHHDDYNNHEFFNASNPGGWHNSRGWFLQKLGRFTWAFYDYAPGAGNSANRCKQNDLFFFGEGSSDDLDCGGLLHGGISYGTIKPPQFYSPSYRVQPFRWQYTGARYSYYHPKPVDCSGGDGPRGVWHEGGADHPKSVSVVTSVARPFIDTQTDPEGDKTWKYRHFWCFYTAYGPFFNGNDEIGAGGTIEGGGHHGQDVKWDWADPVGKNELKVFSLNNLNYGDNGSGDVNYSVLGHYRHMPEDGTYAVIDELKLSQKDNVISTQNGDGAWPRDRIVKEMTLSRYYLPPDPRDPSQCPTFTSQTLFQSLRGFDQAAGTPPEYITLARVRWTAFTPRFMHEYMEPLKFKRDETFGVDGAIQSVFYKGPFDYRKYNNQNCAGGLGVLNSPENYDDPTYDNDNGIVPYRCSRPTPRAYARAGLKPHASAGVEIELLDDTLVIPGFENSSGAFVAATTFRDPEAINSFSPPAATQGYRAQTDKLRYRVRFRYPVDPLADPGSGLAGPDGKRHVDPSKHYLLDTPVFDDISITYFTKSRILSYREVTE